MDIQIKSVIKLKVPKMGRPKGSKNKPKVQESDASASAGGPIITPRRLSDKIDKTVRGVVFCFTVHYGHTGFTGESPENPVGYMVDKIQKYYEKLSDNVYIQSAAMQVERCPTDGRVHLQGYIQWKDTKRMSACFKLFNAHWIRADGTAQENWDYCTKERTNIPDTPRFTLGTPVSQGQRTDVSDMLRDVLEGRMTARDVMQQDPATWMRNYRAIDTMIARRIEPRTEGMHIIYIYGPSGCGKTQWIRDNIGEDFTDRTKWYFKDNTKWWDGYTGQDYVVWDDFDINPTDTNFFRWMLRYMDPQALPIQGESKGGYVEMNSKYLIITSEWHPSHWFEGNTLTQFQRRITQFIHPPTEALKR